MTSFWICAQKLIIRLRPTAFLDACVFNGVYRIYRAWRIVGAANRNARKAGRRLHLGLRRNVHPLRVIIEATSDEPDLKKKSRWTRALEYAHAENVKPKKLVRFFKGHGGISGCAGAASELNPKRRTGKSDWD